ncbi:cellulose biosynthesis protein BcsE [Pseudomonas songnenensis]|uniref:Cellulose biosynthesis protein BcsE n=1 Tax=Pseudomonas songnenensis TaxID=1176259 RepID=A0ABX9UU35_9PSED|nr:cellulose biosynthesis protein BcsE [Pseudomonas songnenensis]MCQ4298336.1 cellulose biosynthesis protein BcsE [Pseudomonas songnenensis]RMH96821.1 cellulose biosynthesis protein BcsE [Pseudomonas songnenensis]
MLLFRPNQQLPTPLGLNGIEWPIFALNEGCLHWIMAEKASDAALLTRQAIGNMEASKRAAMIADAGRQQHVLADLPTDAGPGELLVLTLTPGHFEAMLQRLDSELDRSGNMRARYILLNLPTQAWERLAAPRLSSWLTRIGAWLLKRGATLLIVSDGVSDALSERLLRLSHCLAGFASLTQMPSGTRLYMHHWQSERGMTSARQFALRHQTDGFQLSGGELGEVLEHPDQGRFYAERSVLEGVHNLSTQWRLFESRAALLAHAETARAASIIFAITDNEQVDELAHQLNRLRRTCGNQLKLVIRETAPCLRYRDEQLLLAGGASLVVPFGTSLPRFLTMVESAQGHIWQRQLSDIDASLDKLKPLPLRGQLSPRRFAEAAQEMWAGSATGEIIHQLVRLQPVPGLSLEQVLGQAHLRRNGDIACIVDKALYLFLFACRAESLEAALDNIFGVTWQELFLGLEQLADLEPLSDPGFHGESLSLPGNETLVNEPAPDRQLQPRPLTLSLVTQP